MELGSFNVNGGILSVSGEGVLANLLERTISQGTLDASLALNIERALTVENYIARYEGAGNTGTAALNVTGKFSPDVAGYYGCTLQSGSTLDLNNVSGAWEPSNIKFVSGSISIDISKRKDLRQIANSASPYILKWTSSTPKPENVTINNRIVSAYSLEMDDTGIKLELLPTLKIIIR
jgi:hypothetical protein